MTDTKHPTLLEDWRKIAMANDPCVLPVEVNVAIDRMDTFLSSDLIQNLQDPKLRAAVEVIVEGLPEVMGLEAKATPGPWENDGSDADTYDTHGIAWKSGLVGSVFNQDPRLDHNAKENCDLIVAARNLIFRASQAAQAATDKP